MRRLAAVFAALLAAAVGAIGGVMLGADDEVAAPESTWPVFTRHNMADGEGPDAIIAGRLDTYRDCTVLVTDGQAHLLVWPADVEAEETEMPPGSPEGIERQGVSFGEPPLVWFGSDVQFAGGFSDVDALPVDGPVHACGMKQAVVVTSMVCYSGAASQQPWGDGVPCRDVESSVPGPPAEG